ncbi:MAG TPA: 5'-deoxyadenosine deaminase [Caldithrix abyssi]|uniref:5'-deoxyadenosine deaminase n=1 Tax=Caldithrix abyssi TaxID=187145 RepID=A0A7V5PNA6_CALAY|nr:5'-deoxyadenosine deaminase [Caldithrix abyssi]
MAKTTLIKNALIVTIDARDRVFDGDLLIEDNRIIRLGKRIDLPADEIVNGENLIVIPGFIQTHVHLCQALFRNLADDLALLDWLQKKIWPFEAAHTAETLRISARLGLAEMIASGTTTILDMGTVNHQDVIFEELAQSGIRAFAGKTMMDNGDLPAGLRETTDDSLKQSLRLLEKWHNFDNGRLKYALAPRFALSSSERLLIEAAKMAADQGVILHSHAAENREETQLVRDRFGVGNIALFEKIGAAGPNLCLAHCIWSDEDERRLLKERDIKVLHCPSANLKLGSGIAPVPDYLERGVTVSLGADGAPCNNNMDMFTEMRLAALIQKPLHGPQAMPAGQVLRMATINGARTLGLEDLIGSIESGKLADLTFIRKNEIHSSPFENVYSKLVYSTRASDVEHVMINGKWVMKDRFLLTIESDKLPEMATKAISQFQI